MQQLLDPLFTVIIGQILGLEKQLATLQKERRGLQDHRGKNKTEIEAIGREVEDILEARARLSRLILRNGSQSLSDHIETSR